MKFFRRRIAATLADPDGTVGVVLLFLSMAVVAALVVTGRSARGSDALEVAELRYQGWASQVLFPELAEDLGYLAPLKLKWVGNTISGPQDIQAATTGDTDFGGGFNGAIVKLAAAGAPITAVLGQYGADRGSFTGLYVLDDSPIKTAHDLVGKSIGMNTLGGYQEYLLTDYMLHNGLTGDEVKNSTIVVGPPVNLAQMLRQKRVDATFLSDIAREKATEQGGIRRLASDVDVYGPLTLGAYIFTNKFIAEKPGAVSKFVEATAKAIEWTQTTPRDQVVARMREIIRRRARNEDPTVIDYWKSPGVASKGGVLSDHDFAVYADWYEKLGQLKPGQINVADLYTNRFNPFRDSVAK